MGLPLMAQITLFQAKNRYIFLHSAHCVKMDFTLLGRNVFHIDPNGKIRRKPCAFLYIFFKRAHSQQMFLFYAIAALSTGDQIVKAHGQCGKQAFRKKVIQF